MAFFRFFAEKIPIAVNAVIERNGENLYSIVFVNFFGFFAAELVVNYIETAVRFGKTENGFHHFFNAFWAVNIQRGIAAKEAKRRN